MNGEHGELESKLRDLSDLIIDLGRSELETELSMDEAGDIERLRCSEEFCDKFRTPTGGGVGEKEPLSFEDLTRFDCKVAVLCMTEEGGVGEMESLFSAWLFKTD